MIPIESRPSVGLVGQTVPIGDASDPEQHLLDISLAAERAAALVRQVADSLSKAAGTAGGLPHLKAIEAITSMLQPALSERIGLEQVLRDRGAPVHADSSQLEQVIVNFAVGPRDAMP